MATVFPKAIDGPLADGVGTDPITALQVKVGVNGSTDPNSLDFLIRQALGSDVISFNTRQGAVTLTKADVVGTGVAASDVGALPTTATLDQIEAAAS